VRIYDRALGQAEIVAFIGNAAPVAHGDCAWTPVDTPVDVDVLANDSARPPPPEAHGKPTRDFVLVVKANGEELLSKVIGGSRWQSMSVDLTRSGGFAVNLELHNKTGGRYPWYEEYAYWDNVRVVSTP
jgi:hypothetical protein